MKKVLIANDQGGMTIKKSIVKKLVALGYEVENLGVNSETEKVDYPDVAQKACLEYLNNPGSYEFGILLCGTGIGISIAANKIKGIRCALVHDSFTSTLAKEHNKANFIALGGRIVYHEPVENIVEHFALAQFEGNRHERRVAKIIDLELN